MNVYEIINPSDKAYLDACSPEVAVAAVCIIGEGHYTVISGLRAQGDSGPEFRGPMFLVGGHDEWFQGRVGQGFASFVQSHLREIADALKSARYAAKQTSVVAIVGRAHAYAKAIEEKLAQAKAAQEKCIMEALDAECRAAIAKRAVK